MLTATITLKGHGQTFRAAVGIKDVKLKGRECFLGALTKLRGKCFSSYLDGHRLNVQTAKLLLPG